MVTLCPTTSIIEASFDAVLVFNEDGKFEIVNEAAVTLLGWSRDEFIGKNTSDIFGVGNSFKPQREESARLLNLAHVNNAYSDKETKARRKDGTELSVQLRTAETRTLEGNKRMFCSFLKDLSLQQAHKKATHKKSLQLFRTSVTSALREKKKEKELKRYQNLTMGIVQASLDSLFVTNAHGTIQMVNNAAIQTFGWATDEMVGNQMSKIFGDAYTKYHNQYISSYLKTNGKNETYNHQEISARRKDGSKIFIELHLTVIASQLGEEQSFCAFARDITNKKQDEVELKRRQHITMGILDASFDSLFTINQFGIIHLVNGAAVKQFGWSRNEFVGKNISMIVAGNHAKHHNEYIARYLKTGEKRVMGQKRELLAKRKDGTEFYIELGLTEMKVEDGENRMFCGFIKDISKRKQDEKELRRKEKLTKGILDASFDALFTINQFGIIQMVNDNAVHKFGWTRAEFLGKNISMIVAANHAKHHDEYLARYLKTGETHVIGEQRELLARRKDGSEFHIELGVVEVNVDDGEERVFCGFIKDISRRKRDEMELKQKQEFTVGIIEASFDAMFAINETGTILMVNQASCKKFGWSRDEFIGSNIKMIMDSDHAENHDAYLEQYLATGIKKMMGSQRELKGKRKNGSMFPVMLGLSEMKSDGSSSTFVAFVRDLTDEKNMLNMAVEKAAAEGLLLNMLPENIAKRLKDDPSHIADHFSSTTILFADIVGFTAMSTRMSAVNVVKMLNDLFSRFDLLVDKYNLNKVKTIGDCYMVTSIPSVEHQEDSCSSVCHFALDMLAALLSFNQEHPGYDLNLRIGVNTGPVVAGIVGTKRFLYDLWGDAVNVASRMESTGIPGRIQVTKEVVENANKDFDFQFRSKINVKGKGEMETFFLLHPKHSNQSSMTGKIA